MKIYMRHFLAGEQMQKCFSECLGVAMRILDGSNLCSSHHWYVPIPFSDVHTHRCMQTYEQTLGGIIFLRSLIILAASQIRPWGGRGTGWKWRWDKGRLYHGSVSLYGCFESMAGVYESASPYLMNVFKCAYIMVH